jgi:hypothetical protein
MTLARGLAVRLYGLLFQVLVVVVPRAGELDTILDILDGEGNERSV